MTKLLALAAALTLAAVNSIAPAEAGMRVGIGIGVGGLAVGALGAMANEGRYSERLEYRERRKSRAARQEREEKSTRTAKKAKSEKSDTADASANETAAVTETSSITSNGEGGPAVTTKSTTASTEIEHSSIALTTLGGTPAAAPAAKKIDTASESTNGLGCKKFFPSAGMTLSVPCE